MSLPNKINPADPSGSADPGTLDDYSRFQNSGLGHSRYRLKYERICCRTVDHGDRPAKAIFQNTAANPSAAGEVQRNSTSLKYYDGSAVQTLTTSDQSQTLTNKTLTAPIVTPTLEASLPAAGTEGKVIWLDDGPQALCR